MRLSAERVPTCRTVGFGRITVMPARMTEVGKREQLCEAIPSTAHEEVGDAS